MDLTTELVNRHRNILGHPPVEQADARELLLVEACAEYGADRWAPGVLGEVLSVLTDGRLTRMIEQGDPLAEHDDLMDGECAFADVWREAGRRGLLERR
jgi:hypothetical protein